MSIASEITSIGENLKKDYQSIANLGADLTNVDKNIENIAELLDGVYDNLPKTSYQEGTEITLANTLKGKLDFDNGVVGIGQSSQDGTPTPSTPIAINSVTGNQDVVVKDGNNNTIAIYQLSLGDIELNAIGNYKDELIYDVDEDKVYKNEVIGKKILNGGNDENWAYETAYNRFGLTETINDYNITLRTTAICNYYRYGDTSIDNYFALSSNGKLALFHAPTNISTLAEWKTWLSTNNLILYYILETAIKEEITGTLKDQIKTLYNSQSFTGTTIITSNGNLPMIIKVRGLKGE